MFQRSDFFSVQKVKWSNFLLYWTAYALRKLYICVAFLRQMQQSRSHTLSTLSFCLLFLFACKQAPESTPAYSYQYLSQDKQVELTVELSPKPTFLYDTIEFSIQVKTSKEIVSQFPYLPKTMLQDFELLKEPFEKRELIQENNKYFWIKSVHYLLQAKFAGEITLPRFQFQFRLLNEKPSDPLEDWKTHYVEVNPHIFNIKDHSGDSAFVLNEKMKIVQPRIRIIPLIVGFLGCFLLLIVGIQYLRQRHFASEKETIIFDYKQITLQSLKEFESKRYLEDKKIEEYHTELSQILRVFLEKYLDEKSEKKTTEEFFSTLLSNEKFTSEQKKLLRNYLTLSDQVKFARFQPDEKTNVDALNKVKEIVHFFIDKQNNAV